MNIVLASDDKYVQHCAVTMMSILKNNKDVVFYFLTEGISLENEKKLSSMVRQCGGVFNKLIVPSNIINKCPMPSYMSNHISRATYYRLLITDLLPRDIDKVIYLDCDIVVRKSLSALWNTPIANKAIAAVYQYNEWADYTNSWIRLGIDRKYGYFNAGVLLINLVYWRNNNVKERLFDFINNNYDNIHSHDQDTLNAVLYKETFPLSITWNFLSFFYDDYRRWTFPGNLNADVIEMVKSDPAIVHYVYKPKPWEFACKHPLKNEYSFYLKQTPWCDYKAPFKLGDYYLYVIKRNFSILLHKLLIILKLR